MEKSCSQCDQKFEAKRSSQVFCSKLCCKRSINNQLIQMGDCEKCHKPFSMLRSSASNRKRTKLPNICVTCSKSAEFNGRWQGGHSYWTPGRFGKDKNGLSWKIQRKLAWERDDYLCQHCKTKQNRNPDVHHISPFKESRSHDLGNLISLCQSCHLKEEAKVQENWGSREKSVAHSC